VILLDKLSGADSTSDLRHLLSRHSQHWKAGKAYYLTYDDLRQVLEHGPGEPVALNSQSQPGQAALALRASYDQALAWPDQLPSGLDDGAYRMSLPILHWGSLLAVLMLAFETEPDAATKAAIAETVEVLGVVGQTVTEREKTAEFVLRTQELLVHAVEAQGRAGHVGRCSRLATALATMLDCSAQARAELLQAAQYHDIGLLAFSDPASPAAQREHAARGARLLECHPDLRAVAPLVENHHERYDGSGSPQGRRVADLPLEAWILALTEDLVESYEQAEGDFADRIRGFFHESAKHHHPDVVDALCGLVDSEKLQGMLEG
jgi:hypothetical protein